MPDIADGDSVEVQGSGSRSYRLTNTGGVYSCTCPAWQFQNLPIERRSCKHLRAYRGDDEETARVGTASRAAVAGRSSSSSRSSSSASGAATGSVSAGVAPKVLLAQRWEASHDPTGWWISEKLDGVRAYWDGQRFISRQGNLYMAPQWFTEALPDEPLDGELWVGRGMFQRCVSIVRRMDRSDDWREVSYLVFDAPDHGGVFEERLEYLEGRIAGIEHGHTHLVAHEPCGGIDHLRSKLEAVEALGGEGLMLRQPRSRYSGGRSSSLLKVKNFHDAEARIIDHLPGTGKHDGRLGALRVELPDGTEFSVGTGFSDAEREDPPTVGSMITFRYQELTNAGVPRFPSYIGERVDLSWEQVTWPPASDRRPEPNEHARRVLPVADLSDAEPLPPPEPRARPAVDAAPAPAPAAATPARAPATTPQPPATTAQPEPEAELDEDVEEVSRQLQFEGGRTARFYEVEQSGCKLTITSGRVGRDPKIETLTFPTPRVAAEQAEKLCQAKLDKGYEEF